jgi:hypothetical protein
VLDPRASADAIFDQAELLTALAEIHFLIEGGSSTEISAALIPRCRRSS